MQVFSLHQVLPLQGLNQHLAEDRFVKDSITSLRSLHKEHLSELCLDWDTLVCRTCTENGHKNHHHVETTAHTNSNTNSTLLEKMETLKQLVTETSQAIQDVQTAKLKVEILTLFINDTITSDFQRLHQI